MINSFRIKEKVLAKKGKVRYTVIGKNKHAIGILVSAQEGYQNDENSGSKN